MNEVNTKEATVGQALCHSRFNCGLGLCICISDISSPSYSASDAIPTHVPAQQQMMAKYCHMGDTDGVQSENKNKL